MEVIFNAIVPIVIFIMLGIALKRFLIPSKESWKAMGSIAYNVAFPALLVGDLSHTKFVGLHVKAPLAAIVFATIIVGLITFILKKMLHIGGSQFTSFFQGAIRFNSYIFLGLSEGLYGKQGVAIASFYIAAMIVFTNFLSVFICDRFGNGEKRSFDKTIIETLKNPLIISAVIGFVIGASHVTLPEVLNDTILKIGAMALPLSLIAVGAGMRNVLQSLRSPIVLGACFLKLIALPVFTLYLCSLFQVSGITRCIAVLYSALPVAGNAYILAEQMGGDTDSMASIISLSVIFCVIPLTLIASFVRL